MKNPSLKKKDISTWIVEKDFETDRQKANRWMEKDIDIAVIQTDIQK